MRPPAKPRWSLTGNEPLLGSGGASESSLGPKDSRNRTPSRRGWIISVKPGPALAAVAIDLGCSSRPDAQPQGLLPRAELRTADNISYGAGLWVGTTRARNFRALLSKR